MQVHLLGMDEAVKADLALLIRDTKSGAIADFLGL